MSKHFAVLLLIFCFSGLAAAQTEPPQSSTNKNSEPEKAAQEKTKSEDGKVEGVVTLKVTFLATGKIGEVKLVSAKTNDGKDFDNELIKQAVEAAKNIKFEPPKRNGQPYSVTKTVTYTFTIY